MNQNFLNQARAGRLRNYPNGDILKDVAEGPLKYVQSYKICYVNGYKFHSTAHATRKAADNSGVCVKSAEDSLDEDDFYGCLEDIIELEYPAMPIKRVTLFKCHWYNPSRTGFGHGTRVHQRYKFIDIHLHRSYTKYDPFVLASQATQVYYISYPSTRQNLRDWRAVCKVKSKKYQISGSLMNDNEDSAFQEESISTYVSLENVSLSSESLRDPSQEFIEYEPDADIIDVNENEADDEDVILSNDEQSEDDEDNETDSGDEDEDVL